MASVHYLQPASSFDLQAWSNQPGTVIGATYLEADGQHKTWLSDNFTHDGNTVTGGQIFT